MFYVFAIILADLLIITGNCLFHGAFSLELLAANTLAVLGGTLAVIAIDALGAALIRRLPEKHFSPERRVFYARGRERALYRSVGVKSWSRYVPELGVFTGFHKDRLQSSSDETYLRRFLTEANYGVVIHAVNALSGVVIFFIPIINRVGTALWVVLVNAMLSLAPAIILRYNNALLLKLWQRARRRTKGTD